MTLTATHEGPNRVTEGVVYGRPLPFYLRAFMHFVVWLDDHIFQP